MNRLLAAFANRMFGLSRRFWTSTNQLLVYSSVAADTGFYRRALDWWLYRLSSPGRGGHMWVVEKIEISGGFLPGLSVNIPRGLTCIIGARGSGKSTLAEAVRFALCGIPATDRKSVV